MLSQLKLLSLSQQAQAQTISSARGAPSNKGPNSDHDYLLSMASEQDMMPPDAMSYVDVSHPMQPMHQLPPPPMMSMAPPLPMQMHHMAATPPPMGVIPGPMPPMALGHLPPPQGPPMSRFSLGAGSDINQEPWLFKTKMCKFWPNCPRGPKCWFAHGEGDLRRPAIPYPSSVAHGTLLLFSRRPCPEPSIPPQRCMRHPEGAALSVCYCF